MGYQGLKAPGQQDSSEYQFVGKAIFALTLTLVGPLGRLKKVDGDALNVVFPLRYR